MFKKIAVVLVLFAIPVFSETVSWSDLQKNIDSWTEGPAGLLLTDQEKDVYKKLKAPGEKMQFIKIFWQRRDPILRTRENEFKDDFYRRVDYANQNFAEGKVPGWQTARGMVYLLFGAPSRIDTQSVPDSSRPAQLWVYDKRPSNEIPTNEALMFVYREFKYVLQPPNPNPGDAIAAQQREIDSNFRYQPIPSQVQRAFAEVRETRVIDEKKDYDPLIFSVESTEKFQLTGISFEVGPGEVTIKKEDAPVYDDGERVFAEISVKQERKQGDRVVASDETTQSFTWSSAEFAKLQSVVIPVKRLEAEGELWVTVQDRISQVSETKKSQ